MEDLQKLLQWISAPISNLFKALFGLRKHPRKVVFGVACIAPIVLISAKVPPLMACVYIAVIFISFLVGDYYIGQRDVDLAKIRLKEKELNLNTPKPKSRKPNSKPKTKTNTKKKDSSPRIPGPSDGTH